MNFLDRKPRLKQVLESPLPWQKFLETNILRKNPDDRIGLLIQSEILVSHPLRVFIFQRK